MYLRQVGVVPILLCMENIELWCVGAAWGFCFRSSFAMVRCSDIHRDIPTWVAWCRCYVSVTVGGATATDGTVSLQSA